MHGYLYVPNIDYSYEQLSNADSIYGISSRPFISSIHHEIVSNQAKPSQETADQSIVRLLLKVIITK